MMKTTELIFFLASKNSTFGKVKLAIFVFFFAQSCLIAQKSNPFSIGTFAGINLSQMDGDRDKGYNKAGWIVGVGGVINLKPDFNVNIELAYSELGSKSSSRGTLSVSEGFHPFDIKLQYADVSLLSSLRFKKIEIGRAKRRKKYFYRYAVAVGLSYSRLLETSVDEVLATLSSGGNLFIDFTAASENFNKSNLALVFGGTIFIRKNFGLQIRQSISLNNLYENIDRRFLLYYLSLRGVYYF